MSATCPLPSADALLVASIDGWVRLFDLEGQILIAGRLPDLDFARVIDRVDSEYRLGTQLGRIYALTELPAGS